MRDFFDRTKLFWITEIVRRREEAAQEGELKHMTEKVCVGHPSRHFGKVMHVCST